MPKYRILPYSPFPKGPLLRKLSPKYIHEWSIEDLNYLSPFEQSNFPTQLLRSIKNAKTISRVRFSGDLSKQSILPISHVLKLFRKYIKEIAASSFVRKKLMFLRHLNLKHLTIQLNQPIDWNLFLHSKHVTHLQIFLTKAIPGRSPLASTQAYNNNTRTSMHNKNPQAILAKRFERKMTQLKRHSKSLFHLKRLIFTGEYDQVFLRLLEIFNTNLEYLTSFETLNLTLAYEDTLSLQTIEKAQELALWAYVSDFSVKLNNSMDLVKCQLDSAPKYLNLRSLEIFSLFVVEKDFSFFKSLASLPSLFEVKIMLYGLNGTPSLVQFLSCIHLPDTIENFSLTVKNTFPWVVDYSAKPIIKNGGYQESQAFEKLKTTWEGLKSLKRFHLRVTLIFKEPDVYFFGAWFKMFKALKELYLEIDNDDCIGLDKSHQSPETFDLKCLVDSLGEERLYLEKLTVITKHLMLKNITPDLKDRFRNLKCLSLKYVLAANQSFVEFMKVLPRQMDKLILDELVIKSDQDLECALEGLKHLRLVNIFRLTLYLDTRVSEAKIVEGICELVKHNKMSEEFVLFLNNMILGSANFTVLKNEIIKVGRKLNQMLGKVSDFNCNLCWSCKDCRIYYNQLDVFSEDFY